jgi:SpoIID/LytB domain protein
MVASLTVLAGSIVQPANAASTPNPVPKSFAITGSGWGHGLGMSQYGAFGMALDGKTAPEIISHYYQGAKTSEEATTTNLRVGLLQDRDFVALRGEKHPDASSGGSLVLWIDGVKSATTIPAGRNLILSSVTTNGKPVTIASLDGKVIGKGVIILVKWNNTSSLAHIASGSSAGIAVMNLGTASCKFNYCNNRYRYGYLEVKSGALAGDSKVDLNVVNVLRLSDQYLYGLGEMPSSWHIEALKTQVIAARSFALIKSQSLRSYCDCNLDATDGSQVFSGFSKEFSTSGDKWKRAVDETVGATGSTAAEKARSGLVVKVGTKVVDAYYSSSTGGKTQPRSEVWGTGTISWLVSVPDSWSLDPRTKNPNAKWVKTISQKELVDSLKAAKISVADVAAFEVESNYASGAVSSLIIRDSAGNVTKLGVGPGKTFSPDKLRSLLGIKSTYISSIKPETNTVPGAINSSLQPLKTITNVYWPTGNILPEQFDISGKVAPVQMGANITLQYLSKGKWITVTKAKTNDKGEWEVSWNPKRANKWQVRIVASNSRGAIKTPTQTITAIGKASLRVPNTVEKKGEIAISGLVLPAHPDVVVVLERKLNNGAWKAIKNIKTDKNGRWKFVRPAPNKSMDVFYRVKVSDKRIGTIQTGTRKLVIKPETNTMPAVYINAPKSAKLNSSFIVSGNVSPGYGGVTAILQRKIGNGSWQTVARLKTDTDGKWSSRRYTGSAKSSVSYLVKVSGSRIGNLTSAVQTTKVQ